MQRLLVGAAQEYCVVATPASTVTAPQVIGALARLLPIAGLWTPVAGAVAGCAEVWIAFSPATHPGIPVALAILAVTLAPIGPGWWSVDARLYGRKHLILPKL